MMDNKLMGFIENCKNNTNDGYGTNNFVVIRNPETKIKHWMQFGYDVTYDCIYFNDVDDMNIFINGDATFDYIDNSAKLHDGETIIYTHIDGVNKYVDLNNIIDGLYYDLYVQCMDMYNDEFKRHNFNDLIDGLYDCVVELIYNVVLKNNSIIGYGFLKKMVGYNKKCYNCYRSKYYHNQYDNDCDYAVTIMWEHEFGIMAQKHICNCSHSAYKSIKRHFDKKYDGWDDGTQTGFYLMGVSRNYCTNHFDFEQNINVDYLMGVTL